MQKPLIVGLGGTPRRGSTANCALTIALGKVADLGAETVMFDGPFLAELPHFDPEGSDRTAKQTELVETVGRADGMIIATPAYHGGVSALVKNGLDLLEDLRARERVYLDNMAVGTIVTAYGNQGIGVVLTALRGIVHTLRGWPTPFGAGFNSLESPFDKEGNCTSEAIQGQLELVGSQVYEFAMMQQLKRESA